MRRFFSACQLAHAPALELHNGGFTAYAESPARAEALLAGIGGATEPEDRGDAAIRAVHDAGYLDFLQSAPARWAEAGRPGDM
ncbi:MAG: histone deacetylase family protein, partial [Sphingomonas sp.]|nr:histone deacetylase family protein [Sphingomonas sp.]